jgi:hypothetical protein
MTITELRKNIYKILDEVAETGKQIEIVRKGKKIKITREQEGGKLEQLKNPPSKVCKGDSDEIISIDWSGEWTEGHI